MSEEKQECVPLLESRGTQTDSVEIYGELNFWMDIEDSIGHKIPVYLKNLMVFCGFDTPVVIAKLGDADIADMEVFAKEEMEFFIPKNADLLNYYDKYHVCRDKFKISKGHKLLLKEIQNCVDDKIRKNGFKFHSGFKCKPSGIDVEKYKQNAVTEKDRKIHKNPQKTLKKQSLDTRNAAGLPDINLEHDTLYRMIKAFLKKQPKVSTFILYN